MTRQRPFRPAARTAGIRPHVLRRDGIVQAPSDIPRRGRYQTALAAGWKPLA